jgi:RES domain-containing protein
MYNAELYDVDYLHRSRGTARILENAVLYRLTTTTRCDKPNILNGGAGLHSLGRYHQYQPTTYCGSNILLCIAEVLFHQYRSFIDGIGSQAYEHQLSKRATERMLVIFRVKHIDDLVYADSEGCRYDYDEPRFGGSTVVYPDPTYAPIQSFSMKLRQKQRTGVVFPSARHSRDFAFAFFGDVTDKLDATTYEMLPLRLKLIGEDQDLAVSPGDVSPIKDKLHATMGYYEFVTPNDVERARASKLLNPEALPVRGYVDFVRRAYRQYPADACIWRG